MIGVMVFLVGNWRAILKIWAEWDLKPLYSAVKHPGRRELSLMIVRI